MHDVEVLACQQSAERRQPPQIRVVGGAEGVDTRSPRHDRRHQGVLVLVHVGHLVVEPSYVAPGHHVHQQAFGAPVAEALDDQQHSQGPIRRTGPKPLFNAHAGDSTGPKPAPGISAVRSMRDTVGLPCRSSMWVGNEGLQARAERCRNR